MLAAFDVLGIKNLTVANSALREGVLYELLGRMQHQDTRTITVNSFMRRYHVDKEQVKRVQTLALNLLENTQQHITMDDTLAKQYLTWAAMLHEIGISIAHSGYHKHSAYIVENADMPGFSKMDQEMLGLLLRAQRRSLSKLPSLSINEDRCLLIMVLRLSVLFHRNRQNNSMPKLHLTWEKSGFSLSLQQSWLSKNPLTQSELVAEVNLWKDVNINLAII